MSITVECSFSMTAFLDLAIVHRNVMNQNIEVYMKPSIYLVIVLIVISLAGCGESERSLEVTATAYTSSPGETNSTPNLAAWGDTLEPGMKAIAVSRDLLKMGLVHNKEIRIKGLKGSYTVLDKMNKRWKKKIDIYMGNDVKKAKKWGNQKVVIYWVDDNS